ncbi:MAG: ABA4-like family protein [Granulosicoccus sp.]
MNPTEPADVFQIANALALPGWLWLLVWLFLPQKQRTQTRYIGLVLPMVLAVCYAAAALVYFADAQGGFDSLDNVLSLFKNPGATLAGWVHFLSFDLFVGWCIAQHAIHTRKWRVLVIPCLLLTFMLGPVGLFLYGLMHLAQRISERYPIRSKPSDPLIQQFLGGQSSLTQSAVISLAILPVLFLAYAMDTRTLLDANVWIKPVKFASALFIYTLTLAWYANYLPDSLRDNRHFKLFGRVILACVIAEMLWLIYASATGQPSHFNESSAIMRFLYPLMGVLAVILTAMSLLMGLALLRHEQSALHPLTRYSLAYGLIATFVLTFFTAGYLAAGPIHSHAVLPEGILAIRETNTVPFLGWLREAGDLRVAHFFATHALHSIPLVGFLLAHVGAARKERNLAESKRNALLLTAGYSIIVGLMFLQALMGRPFIS